MSVGSSPSSITAGWHLEQTYSQLPPLFFASVEPTPVKSPRLVVLNRSLADGLGLNPAALDNEDGAAIFTGNRLPPGSTPIAQAYAGHQYGHFTGLGDGRAILLGEQVTPRGERFDVQLKGSGPTPFSRRGDGRAALGPMLREYIISEAMHALGIPTTRSLAVAATGEEVWRQEGPLPGAVLTRVAASHIRVGTFQWAAARGGEDAIRALVEYTLRRHFSDQFDSPNRAEAMLRAAIARQAELIAQWMLVGFVHGVMNTDNMALSGETIDYGPCAFIDAYDPATVFSSIDAHGRYAFGNQPSIAQWNLARLAEALLPILHKEESKAVEIANAAIESFQPQFERHWIGGFRRKLGLFNEEVEDVALIDALLTWMQKSQADYVLTFGALTHDAPVADCQREDAEYREWLLRWKARLARQPQSRAESEQLQRRNNPAFIPRNHLVEAALAAAQGGDLTVMERLLDILSRPFAHERDENSYRLPATSGSGRYRTFCGT